MAAIRCGQLRYETEQLQQDIEVGLRAPADYALQGITVLTATIENLYHETQKSVTTQNEEVQQLVKLAKGQAHVVAKRFKSLSEDSRKLMDRGGEASLI
jgi:23S rRNA maturation mini-RNase III